jgi:hypothetical protein
MQERSNRKHKSESRGGKVLSDLEKLSKDLRYKEQFSAERLADAMATCREDWDHFANSSGAYPSHGRRQWLPDQLAKTMFELGLRSLQVQVPRGVAPSAWMEDAEVRPMRQRFHQLTDTHGISCGSTVSVINPTSKYQAKNVEELKARPIVAGLFAITMPAKSSTLARSCPGLQNVNMWLWKVLRVVQPGYSLPPNTRHAITTSTTTYECQLYAHAKPYKANSPFRPLWDKLAEAHFLKTPTEKLLGTKPGSTSDLQAPKMLVPLIGMLRPENIICSGFTLTCTNRLPAVAHEYMSCGENNVPLAALQKRGRTRALHAHR